MPQTAHPPQRDTREQDHAPARPHVSRIGRALDALFREARLLERRRRRRYALIVLLVCVAVAGAVYAIVATGRAATSSADSSSAGLPVGVQVVPEQPSSLAVGPGGQVYVADDARNQILEWTGHGTFRVVAGSGQVGFSGDGGSALRARIDQPGGMSVATDGTLYFADIGNGRIRAISPAGTMRTIAGDGLPPTGRDPWIANGTPARHAALGEPNDVAIGPGGELYFDASANDVLRLDHDDTISVVAGNRTDLAIAGIGGPATKASPDEAWGLALDRRGDLFINGGNTRKLLMVTPSGRMTLPIGLEPFYPRGPGGMVTTSSGEVVAMTDEGIVRLSPHEVTPIVNLCCRRIPSVGVFELNGIAPAPDGGFYADTSRGNGFARANALAEIKPDGRVRLLWTSAK
jgi:sugar lactone lactonase YvrE